MTESELTVIATTPIIGCSNPEAAIVLAAALYPLAQTLPDEIAPSYQSLSMTLADHAQTVLLRRKLPVEDLGECQ